jgi:diguanylate cyclase (GGDEF)-like protein
VAWVEPGHPVPRLLPPFEWASTTGQGLVEALERCAPWMALRRERDAAQAQSELSRRLVTLLREPDAEGFHDALLGELCTATSAGAGALWLAEDTGRYVLRARVGLETHAVPEALAPDAEARALLLAGRPWMVEGPGLWVPLSARGEGLGVAQLTQPVEGSFGLTTLEAAATFAGHGAVALLSARRFRALQRLALRDPDSSAYNLAYFTDYASKEIDKARRYGRGFSLLIFSLEGLPHLRARAGVEPARAAVRATTRALGRVLRESDVLAKVAEQEFLLLLPETDPFGAQIFLRRALSAARESPELRAIEAAVPLHLQGGAATFPRDGEDFDLLTSTCRARLEQRRASLHRRLLLDSVSFWEAVELLLGSPEGRSCRRGGGDPSRRGGCPRRSSTGQAEIGRALTRDPGSRGLVYPAERRRDRAAAGAGPGTVEPDFLPGCTSSPGAPR